MSKGRCFVYVLPCRERDLLKVGFSRDPVSRLRALHSRYFELFDLERSALVEMDHVRDARAIEKRLKVLLADNAAQPPLTVRSAAGGRTEWFLGSSELAFRAISNLESDEGHVVHASLATWLRTQWQADATLFDWSASVLDAIELATFNDGEPRRLETVLRNVLDSFEAVGLELAGRAPQAVLDWYRQGFRSVPDQPPSHS